MMLDARLLTGATPRPWTVWRYRHGAARMSVGDRLVADVYHAGDVDLIEAAVDGYERAARIEKALRRFVELYTMPLAEPPHEDALSDDNWFVAMGQAVDEAKAALESPS